MLSQVQGGGDIPLHRVPETPERLCLLVSTVSHASGVDDTQDDLDNPAVSFLVFRGFSSSLQLFPQSKGDLHAHGVFHVERLSVIGFHGAWNCINVLILFIVFPRMVCFSSFQETIECVIRVCQNRAA